MADMCGDNRFEIIASAKKALLEGTNIDMCPDEMAVIDNILFRCWQMGWLEALERKVRADKADRKTEPTISKMEQVEDEPLKTTDYCDICKRDMCEVCIADATNPYCVPSHYEINYEPKDEPQTNGYQTFNGTSVYVSRIEDEPQTERYCTNCKHNGVIEDYECRTCNSMNHHEFIQPQTERSE